MSNSLTINTPNIVKQNTPLRNVPSGSTAEPDYNVKYVPQSLTEAQKAQARENIGAGTPQVQADWNQADTTAVDYIKNKPESLGGNAAELDKYWTVYPEGATTISLHAGTINKMWMNGEEIEAVSDVYSVNAFSVVRIDATSNVSFIFDNTADPIWLWSPAGVTINEPVFGTAQNVNLVNNGNAGTYSFGGKVWMLGKNKLTESMFTMTTESVVNESPVVYFNDSKFDYTSLPSTAPANNDNPVVYYVHKKRYDSLRSSLVSMYGSSWFDVFSNHIIQYDGISKDGWKLTKRFGNVDDYITTITVYNESNNTYYDYNSFRREHSRGILIGNEVNGKFIESNLVLCSRGRSAGRLNPATLIQSLYTIYPGKNVLVFNNNNYSERQFIKTIRWNNYWINNAPPLWVYAKKVDANPLLAGYSIHPSNLNQVFEDSRIDSFGAGGGGTQFIFNENNSVFSTDEQYWLNNTQTIVFTDKPMSGVIKGIDITSASDVLATIYCPATRYDELVQRFSDLYSSEIEGGTMQLSWITDHIVKYATMYNEGHKIILVPLSVLQPSN